jgi:ubiquinone/menaquinone biosynthesis C-methylase UbiE
MMNEFDSKAREWDNNPVHWERSKAVARYLMEMIPLNKEMKALEFGAGTGILSFLLHDHFSEITLMDSSQQMVKVIHEKVFKTRTKNLKPLLFDLEHSDYHANKFDVIYSQMVLHHVNDIKSIFNKFYSLLNTGGYLAIADLYTEDGSFHGQDVEVHRGFDPDKLKEILKLIGYKNTEYKTCFEIKREPGEKFPVFLLLAKK